eukprot:3885079-Rhodomonas_salina.1
MTAVPHISTAAPSLVLMSITTAVPSPVLFFSTVVLSPVLSLSTAVPGAERRERDAHVEQPLARVGWTRSGRHRAVSPVLERGKDATSLSSTDAYDATSSFSTDAYGATRTLLRPARKLLACASAGRLSPMVLRLQYALSGTELGFRTGRRCTGNGSSQKPGTNCLYQPTRALRDVRY